MAAEKSVTARAMAGSPVIFEILDEAWTRLPLIFSNSICEAPLSMRLRIESTFLVIDTKSIRLSWSSVWATALVSAPRLEGWVGISGSTPLGSCS
jgi:hypothetical protein